VSHVDVLLLPARASATFRIGLTLAVTTLRTLAETGGGFLFPRSSSLTKETLS